MKGFVLTGRILSDCEKWILREGKKYIKELDHIPITQVYVSNFSPYFDNKKLSSYDFVIPRLPRTYVWYGYTVLSLIRNEIFSPILPEALIFSHNKFLTLLILSEYGLPVPETFLSLKRKNLEEILDRMGFPVVFKLLYGSLGKGVMFADSKPSALSIMDTLERFSQPIFLEEFVPHRGYDIRTFVLGDRVLAAEKRVARKGERRTNIGIGGRGVFIRKLDPEIEELSIKAAKALGMQICGMDIIEGPDGPVIIEANVNVHFEGLAKVSGINVAREIVKFVRDEAKEQKMTKFERLMKWLRISLS
ncbi:MAG: RimK family alpha-L-glutamate ligase [Candidatus Aenigmarchaeota archaeon]|nr:RimK family alpha-L-glutamate ligase [Candidatus Aenigmarchaeota archaeon]